jgi:hypothetical protein
MASDLPALVSSVLPTVGISSVYPDAIQAIVLLTSDLNQKLLREPTENSLRLNLPGEIAKLAINYSMQTKQWGYLGMAYIIGRMLQQAQAANISRNRLMKTTDLIDSYDVCRGCAFLEEFRNLFKIPSFPYQTDPDPKIKTDSGPTPDRVWPPPSSGARAVPGSQFTLGARAALTSYYKTFAANVAQQNAEEINRSMAVMGLTPNARIDLSRQLLVSEVDRRINQELRKRAQGQVTFLDLLNILAVVIAQWKH